MGLGTIIYLLLYHCYCWYIHIQNAVEFFCIMLLLYPVSSQLLLTRLQFFSSIPQQESYWNELYGNWIMALCSGRYFKLWREHVVLVILCCRRYSNDYYQKFCFLIWKYSGRWGNKWNLLFFDGGGGIKKYLVALRIESNITSTGISVDILIEYSWNNQ